MSVGPARIDLFIQRLETIEPSDEGRIWNLCLNEIQHLKTAKWIPYQRDDQGAVQPRFGYTLKSLRGVLRDYRNAIRSRFGADHVALKFLRPSNDDQAQYKKAYRKQLYTDQTHLRPIDPDALVGQAEAVLRNADLASVFDVGAALALVTGRRPFELLCVGSFRAGQGRAKILRNAGKQTVIFGGQAKTRQSPNAQLRPYEIPTLVERSLVLSAFRAMRRGYDFESIGSVRQFTGHVGKEMLLSARQLFADARGAPMTLKDLRSAYATIADHWLRPDEISSAAFFTRVLGHAEDQTEVSLAYNDFYCLGEKRATVRNNRDSARRQLRLLERTLSRQKNVKARKDIAARMELLQSLSA